MGMNLYYSTKVISKKEYQDLQDGRKTLMRYGLKIVDKSIEDIQESKKSVLFDLLKKSFYDYEKQIFDELVNLIEDRQVHLSSTDFIEHLEDYYELSSSSDEYEDIPLTLQNWLDFANESGEYWYRDVKDYEIDGVTVYELIDVRYW